MTTHTPSNSRVPLIGPRSRYLLLSHEPLWIYHKMATGAAMTGVAPQTATTDAAHTDPTVSAGVGAFTALTLGGLFTTPACYGHPMVVEAVDNPGSATVVLVNNALGTTRAMPAVPFKVGAGETLQGITATTGVMLGFLVREAYPHVSLN